MVVQASAAEAVLGNDPARARRAIQDVQRTGRDALEETRGLLHLLRHEDQDDLPAAATPQPGLRDLTALPDRFPGMDLDLDLDVDVDPGLADRLPNGAEVSVYRVVQEAVTNVVKHSASAAARVRVHGDDEEVVVEVHDPGPALQQPQLPGGHGLVGMGERVALYGGRLQAGSRDDGGFRVVAWFPVRGSS